MPVGKHSKGDSPRFRWWCPGCETMHIVPVDVPEPSDKGWGFNGSEDNPTLTPSVLVYPIKTFIDRDVAWEELTKPENIKETPRCHCFVRDGQIEFLGDSTHALVGQTVPMEDL